MYKGKKANIDSYSAFFDNCKANDTGLTKQLEDAGVTDVYCNSLELDFRTCKGQADCKLCSMQLRSAREKQRNLLNLLQTMDYEVMGRRSSCRHYPSPRLWLGLRHMCQVVCAPWSGDGLPRVCLLADIGCIAFRGLKDSEGRSEKWEGT